MKIDAKFINDLKIKIEELKKKFNTHCSISVTLTPHLDRSISISFWYYVAGIDKISTHLYSIDDLESYHKKVMEEF